jgi:hypothetical protein
MAVIDELAPESSRRMKFFGYSDQGGRPDGCQVMVSKGHAYVCHVFGTGLTVIDVRDPRAPKPVGFLPVHPASWSIHCQTHGNLMLVVEEFNFYSVYNSERSYYTGSISGVHSSRFGNRGEDYSAGLRVYDLSNPASPRAIGFMEVEGLGLHRVWWVGDRYAYASAFLDGYTDHVLIVIDLVEPTKPVEVGRWWLPGMWAEGKEDASGFDGRVALHHAVIADDFAYGCWRDGGLTILDIKDKTSPRLVAHRNLRPPFAGGTHSALPLHDRDLVIVADEAVQNIDVEPYKHIWIMDIRTPSNPVTIATMPVPSDQNYVAKGGHFGPHNLWENRPEGYQSSQIIFATYQNAGLRCFDIANPFRPEEVGWFVPPLPKKMIDTRPGIVRQLHSADVYVDKSGLAYLTDFNAGLYVIEVNLS